MKQILLSLLAVLCSVNMWAETTTTWNFSDDGWAAGTTKDGLTPGSGVTFDENNKSIDDFSFTKRCKLGGTISDTKNVSFAVTGPCTIKVYGCSSSKNTTRSLTIKSGSYNGTTVVESFASNDGNAIDGYTCEYTGSAATLYLGSSNSGYNLYAIQVTYSNKTNPNFSVTPTTTTVKLGNTATATWTSDNKTGTVSAQSSDANIATATVSSNTVTITPVAIGEATITLTQDGDDTYDKGTATMAITVVSAFAPTTLINYNHASEVTTGIENLGTTDIASVKIHSNKDAVNCIQLKNGYTTKEVYNENAIKLTCDGGFKAGDVVSIAGFFNNSDDTKESMADLFVLGYEDAISVLWTSEQFTNGRTSADDPTVQTYTLTADADVLYIGRNGNTSTNIYSIKVERPTPLATITVSATGYATYYNSASAYTMPEGMTGNIVTIGNGRLTLSDNYKAGSVVPAGEPLVLAAEAGSYDLYSAITNETASTSNDLAGTDEETALAADANSCFYALTLDNNGANPGFYWMADNGAAFTNGAHKAYLKVAKAAGAKTIGYAFNEDATAIKSVATTTATDGKIYDMTGREVKAPKAGLYIVNGVKKYIK